MKKKEGERQSHFQPNGKETDLGEANSKAKDEVLINAGLMEYDHGERKPLRGKSLPVKLLKSGKIMTKLSHENIGRVDDKKK